MAEEQSSFDDTEFAADEAPDRMRALIGLLNRMKIPAFMLAVVAVECAVAYFYVPTFTETTAMAERVVEEDVEAAEKAAKEEEEAAAQHVEFDLGDFSITAYQPDAITTLRIEFHLYGAVHENDVATLTSLMDERRNRIRDEVIATVRSADVADLYDPGLGLIKRQILEKSNRALGQPLLKSIIFSEFSFIEQ